MPWSVSSASVDDQRLHVGHVGKEGEDLQRINELEGFVLAALDLEGEDGSTAVREVFLIGCVVGVVRQGRMVNLGHLGVLGKVVHDLQRIGHVPLDAQGERFQALEEDETAHRGERGAGIPEQDSAGAGDVGGGADGIGKDDPVVAVLRLRELRELAGRNGVAKVLSTTSGIWCRWAIAATFSMSMTLPLGLPKVSMNRSFVSGRMAFSKLFRSAGSTKVVEMP